MGDLTQIKRHRGAKLGGGDKGSLTHGKNTPGIGGHAYESGIEKRLDTQTPSSL
jgi:hypothetical protein